MHEPPDPRGDRFCWSALLVLAVLLLPSCCSTESTDTWKVTAREIVAIHTETHAEVELDRESDGERVRAFLARLDVADARTRRAVMEAWRDSAELGSKAPRLPQSAFEAAEADASWPEEQAVPEMVYVEGFRAGLESFLGGS